MIYQPFSRADRKRWRRGDRPRAALLTSEWLGWRFANWAATDDLVIAVKFASGARRLRAARWSR